MINAHQTQPAPFANGIKKDPIQTQTHGRAGILIRSLLGLALAASVMFQSLDAAAATRMLNVIFKMDMVKTGVETNASGNISGMLLRSGQLSNQQLKLSVAHLHASSTYQLIAFVGDETSPRSLGGFTTDANGAFAVTYVQRCPGNSSRGGIPLPNAVDPISRIHQLDVVKDGNVIMTVVIGSDLQSDCTAATVSSTTPANAATGVAINQAIAATFSEPLNAATINKITFTLKHGTKPVSGTVTNIGTTAIFTPTSALLPNTTYTATITTRVEDQAGNRLASNFVWSFTTGAAPDASVPIVSSSAPVNAASNVPVSRTLTATFSKMMNPATINATTFQLTGPGATHVTGTVAYDVTSRTATFAPGSALLTDTHYTATITTGAKDLAGNAVASNFVWSFTTAHNTDGQAGDDLGTSAGFAVLAGSTATSTGATTVNGHLGVSAGTAVTGFPPGLVNGVIFAGDSTAAQAQLDLTTAYNDAAGRTVGAVTVAGNLGGRTLTPGLYKSTSSLEISSGDLTLDAQGDANAVFIFQMASTLTTTSGRLVILSGGAKASNVYWQVGTSATLGTTSVFKGTIMADQSITLTTGATLDGRALARIGAVTMDSNIIIIPAP